MQVIAANRRTFASLEARKLFKDYGRRRALSGVDLQLRAGEATVLLGDNGAGKSTLLNLLATLLRPTRGQVLFDGLEVEALDAAGLRRQLGVLSHEPRCYGDLTARENLRFFGRLYDLPTTTLAPRVEALLGRLSLLAAADRPARTYSRGMLQRLAVGRTLLAEPGVLLMDEPYTGLDRGGVALLTELLQEQVRAGAILLLISHDLLAVAPLCQRALLLQSGRLCADQRFAPGTCDADALARLYVAAGGRVQQVDRAAARATEAGA